jgi:hypothetical protein
MNSTNGLTCVKPLIIALSMLVLFIPARAADMYKWIDNEGVVHFSDERPEGVANTKSVRVEEPDAKADTSKVETGVPRKSKVAVTAPAKGNNSLHKLKNFPILQQDPNWCALTSIAMVAQYYGYRIDPMQVSIESGIPLERGMTLEAILKYLEHLKVLKLDAEYHYRGNLEEIKQYIDNNIPVMWLHLVPARRGWGRHVAVVIGYDDKERRMIVADPAFGTEISYTYIQFMQRWHGTSELIIAVTLRI